jgi:hypothetical protein
MITLAPGERERVFAATCRDLRQERLREVRAQEKQLAHLRLQSRQKAVEAVATFSHATVQRSWEVVRDVETAALQNQLAVASALTGRSHSDAQVCHL